MLVRQRSLTLAVLLIGTFFGSASMLNAQSVIACIPPIGSVVNGAGPDPVDGKVEDDERWAGAMRVNLNAIGSGRMAFIQFGSNTGSVYIAGQIEDSGIPVNTNDALVLAFHTSASTANDWKIVINPFDSSTSTGASNSRNVMTGGTIMAYRNSATWNNGLTGFVPGAARANWLTSAVFISRVPTGSSNGWSFEMKIPMAASAASDDGIFFPPSAQFDFYFDVLKAVDVTDAMTIQAPWPTNKPSAKVPGSASDFLGDNTPDLPWGKVSLDPSTCAGVSLTQISVSGSPATNELAIFSPVAPYPAFPANCASIPSNPDPDLPLAASTNTIHVKMKNTHATLAATGVNASVYVSPFGVAPVAGLAAKLEPFVAGPPAVGVHGVTTTPPTITPGPLTVPSGGADQDFSVLQWRLTYRQSCDFTVNGIHHCIFVQLDAPQGGVNVPLVVSSRGDNFLFVPGSRFSNVATISNDYKDLVTANRRNDFALVVTTLKEQYRAQGDMFLPANDPRTNAPGVDLRAFNVSNRRGIIELPDPIPASTFPKGLVEAVKYNVSAYRFGDGRLILNSRTGKRYRTGNYLGSYGYLVGHERAGAVWQASLTGAGIKEAFRGLYQLTIPLGSVARVIDTIQAFDGRPEDAPPIPGNSRGCMRRTPPAPIIGIFLAGGLYAYRPRRRDDDDWKSQ